jgi:hypothetical protein
VEEFAVAIGGLIGAMVAAFGTTAFIGLRLWRGLKSVAKGTTAVRADMSEALGSREDDDATAPHRERRKTGSFQTIVRDELDAHLAPLDRRFDRLEDALDGISTRQADLDLAVKEQAELIADLSRSHGKVAARTAEHSAKLNVASAEESMARGRL